MKDNSFVDCIHINEFIALQKILDCLRAKNIKTNISSKNAEEILKLIEDLEISQWDGASKFKSSIKAFSVNSSLTQSSIQNDKITQLTPTQD